MPAGSSGRTDEGVPRHRRRAPDAKSSADAANASLHSQRYLRTVDVVLALGTAAVLVRGMLQLGWSAFIVMALFWLPLPINDLMTAPYARIIILHVTLIASGFLVQALGAPTAGALLLVGLKLAYDLRTIRRESERDGDDEAAAKARRLLVTGRRRLDGRS